MEAFVLWREALCLLKDSQYWLDFPALSPDQWGERVEAEVDGVKLTERLRNVQISDSVAKRRFLSDFSMKIYYLLFDHQTMSYRHMLPFLASSDSENHYHPSP